MRGRKRHPKWQAAPLSRLGPSNAAELAHRDYVSGSVRPSFGAGHRELVEYLKHWRTILSDELAGAVHAHKARESIASAIATMTTADPRLPPLQRAIEACAQVATLTTFTVVERAFSTRGRRHPWRDIVIERVRYVHRGGRPPSTDRRWQVLADHLLDDDEIASITNPGQQNRASAKQTVAARRYKATRPHRRSRA